MAMDNSQTFSGGSENPKAVHTILLDASPILLNAPSISTLLANCQTIVTTPSVIAEIRGEEARNRFETLYKPFVTVRSPSPKSIQHVREFAKRTGDLAVLSVTDLEVLALAYDLECERNEGDWRLRNIPGQKKMNRSPPSKNKQNVVGSGPRDQETHATEISNVADHLQASSLQEPTTDAVDESSKETGRETAETESNVNEETLDLQQSTAVVLENDQQVSEVNTMQDHEEVQEQFSSTDTEDGWITPSNIKRHQRKHEATSKSNSTEDRFLQVATMTGDFSLQNVLLQMNLNLLSTNTCKRVTNIRQTILRCHACFATTREMSKQFCFRCGKPTLTRVTCTTNDKGEVKLHLKSNFQWKNKGNVYSIPKPVSGSSNQKWKGPKQGGGKGGWGQDLVLAEDQKEYVRAISKSKRAKEQDLMDEDAVPSIFSGQRNNEGRSVRVGAGRNVNSRKR